MITLPLSGLQVDAAVLAFPVGPLERIHAVLCVFLVAVCLPVGVVFVAELLVSLRVMRRAVVTLGWLPTDEAGPGPAGADLVRLAA